MAPAAALTLVGPSRAVPGRLRGSRGVPTRVVLEVNDALAPCIEGVAFVDEVVAAVNRIVMAAAAGSRQAVVNEAGKLGHRAIAERAEFRRLAAAIEGPDGGRAA
ncbi:MAG: hypothetical protein V4515_12305 [Chloroflexota bacterium]